jgi:virginiamycin A acetyltransferase
MKHIIYRIFLKFFWIYYNWKNKTRIYNHNLPHRIKIGKKVMIRNKTEIGTDFSIGDYSYISGPINYIEAAHIGKYCSIARQCVIGVSGHPYHWVTTGSIIHIPYYGFIDENVTQPQKSAVVIGNDVWVGINAIISRGVSIGHGAIIAAGAVVTKDVEPYSIVGGSPAKHIKYRFSKEVIEQLLLINWWDWDESKLKIESKYMYDINTFVSRNSK